MHSKTPTKTRSWLVLAFGLFLLTACSEKIEPGNTPAGAENKIRTPIAAAGITRQPVFYDATGTVAARTASTLASKIMGTVKSIKVREGDRVKKDDVLVSLDQRQVDAGLSQAAAALEEARKAEMAAVSARQTAAAGAQLAGATYERYRQLMEKDSVSRQEFDEITARNRQAQATLSQAEAMVNAAKSRVRQAEAAWSATQVTQKDATILAPYDGVITAKRVDPGDLAAPGTPLLDIQAATGFQVDLTLPENLMAQIRPDQSIPVTIPALGESAITGVVDTIVPISQAASRSFIAKVRLPPREALTSGMFARARVPLDTREGILVPASAIVSHGQLTGMYLVGQDGVARFRLVRIGRSFDDQVEVLSGLAEKTVYVVSPPPQMVDGAIVEAAP